MVNSIKIYFLQLTAGIIRLKCYNEFRQKLNRIQQSTCYLLPFHENTTTRFHKPLLRTLLAADTVKSFRLKHHINPRHSYRQFL